MNPIIMAIITSAISAIIGAVVGAVVAKLKTASKDAQESREMQRETLLMTCRMAVYDEHFSVDEKLEAYTIYRKLGGNHQTKKYMDELVGSDVDEYLEKHKGVL